MDDDVEVPSDLKLLQNIKASRTDCKTQIVNSINYQMNVLGIDRKSAQTKGGLTWERSIIEESWDGIPGYELVIHLLNFHSKKYKYLADIGDHIKGILLNHVFEHRKYRFEPHPELYNYGQESFYRTDIFEARASEPMVIGTIGSIQYTMMRYSAGTAHPGHWFETFNFFLEPPALISPIKTIFKSEDDALPILQSNLRNSIYRYIESNKDHSGMTDFLRRGIDGGTSTWDHLNKFRFTPEGMEFFFGDYQLWGYAGGTHSAVVPYKILTPTMKHQYVSALGLSHLPR